MWVRSVAWDHHLYVQTETDLPPVYAPRRLTQPSFLLLTHSFTFGKMVYILVVFGLPMLRFISVMCLGICNCVSYGNVISGMTSLCDSFLGSAAGLPSTHWDEVCGAGLLWDWEWLLVHPWICSLLAVLHSSLLPSAWPVTLMYYTCSSDSLHEQNQQHWYGRFNPHGRPWVLLVCSTVAARCASCWEYFPAWPREERHIHLVKRMPFNSLTTSEDILMCIIVWKCVNVRRVDVNYCNKYEYIHCCECLLINFDRERSFQGLC